jgi:hypothetical protein
MIEAIRQAIRVPIQHTRLIIGYFPKYLAVYWEKGCSEHTKAFADLLSDGGCVYFLP